MATRLFLMGVITLFFGAQLRAVDTFVLNEKVSRIVNRRIERKSASTTSVDAYEAGLYDLFDTPAKKAIELPTRRRITPPRWLGWSFLSIGAVLVFTCPLFRKG